MTASDPKRTMHGRAERICLHTLHERTETVATLLKALDALCPWFDDPGLKLYRAQHALVAAIAHAHDAIARGELVEATARLTEAALAVKLDRHRDAWPVKVLRAVVSRMRGEADAPPLVAEARGLAALGGCERLLDDTHRSRCGWARNLMRQCRRVVRSRSEV